MVADTVRALPALAVLDGYQPELTPAIGPKHPQTMASCVRNRALLTMATEFRGTAVIEKDTA